jgi:2-hydroxychromene-2-carboxylate isomerase
MPLITIIEDARYTKQAQADGVFEPPFYPYARKVLWGQDRLDFL